MAALVPYRYKYSVLLWNVFWPSVQQQNVQKSLPAWAIILGQLLCGVAFEQADFYAFFPLTQFEKLASESHSIRVTQTVWMLLWMGA